MDSLPDDIIIQILACLPPEEVSKAGLINKHFRYLCNSEQLWKRLVQEYFTGDAVPNLIESLGVSTTYKRRFTMLTELVSKSFKRRPTTPYAQSTKLEQIERLTHSQLVAKRGVALCAISGQRKTHLKCAIFGSTATPFFEYNCENSSNMELNFPRLFSDVVFVSLENLGELIVDGNPTIEGVQARNNLIEAFARQKNNTTNKTNRLLVLWTATNSPQLIDDELSSFVSENCVWIHIPLPGPSERRLFIKQILAELRVELELSEEQLHSIVERSDGMTYFEIIQLFAIFIKTALYEHIVNHLYSEPGSHELTPVTITPETMASVLDAIQPSNNNIEKDKGVVDFLTCVKQMYPNSVVVL